MAGRPPKVDKFVVDKWEQAFAIGCTDSEACAYADVSRDLLYDYQKKHPEFIDRKNSLKERPILKARQEVVKGLSNNPELALKFLERKKKDEFSLRQEIDQKSEVKIDGNVNVEWETFFKNNQDAMEQAKDTIRAEKQARSKKGVI